MFKQMYKDIEDECKKYGRTDEEIKEAKKACTKALLSFVAGAILSEAIVIKLLG